MPTLIQRYEIINILNERCLVQYRKRVLFLKKVSNKSVDPHR